MAQASDFIEVHVKGELFVGITVFRIVAKRIMQHDSSNVMKESDMTIECEIQEIDPKTAADILQKTMHPSPANQRQVDAYAADMAAGAWKMNGEPIVLSDQDVVLSGRLRLMACTKAGVPFTTAIVKGVDPKNFESLDTLRRRTVADVLNIRNEKSGRALAAALTFLWRFSKDDHYKQSLKVPSQAILAILEAHPEIRVSLDYAARISPALPHGMGGALHYLFSTVDAGKAKAFFDDVRRSIEGIEVTNAAGLLGRLLQAMIVDGGRRSPIYLAAITIKAWNAYASNREPGQLRVLLDKERPVIDRLPENLILDGSLVTRLANDNIDNGLKNLEHLVIKHVHLTPDLAERLLERNDGNRRIAQAVVDKYARDIKSGDWCLNGQTIKIGTSGRLLDGQHRCAAVMAAGKPINTFVVENLDESVFDTFDLGQRRSLAEVLKERGEQNTSTLAAVLRQLWMFDHGYIQLRNVTPTNAEMLKVLEDQPDIRRSVGLAHKFRDVMPTSIGCCLHKVFSRVSEAKATNFMEALGSGANLGLDSPILKLRNLLQRHRASAKRSLSNSEQYALVIKAWNAYYDGVKLGSLKWQNSGGKKESFPKVAGLKSKDEEVQEAA